MRAFFCFLDGPEHEVNLSVGTVLRSILHLWFNGCIRLAVGHGDRVSVGMFDERIEMLIGLIFLMPRYTLDHSCLISVVVVSHC